MTVKMPPLSGQFILRYTVKGEVRYSTAELKVNTMRDEDGRIMGSPILIETRWLPEHDTVYEAWAPIPDPHSPWWIQGKPNVNASHLKCPERWVTRGAPIAEHYGAPGHCYIDPADDRPLPFPGFWGGPMTRYEGVRGWFPVEDLEFTPFPQAMRTPVRPLDVLRLKEIAWAQGQGESIGLAVINDGDLYRRHWQGFAMGKKVRHSTGKWFWASIWTDPAKSANQMSDWEDRKRSALLWAMDHVYEWCRKNPDFVDQESLYANARSLRMAKNLAAQLLLDHYVRAYKDAKAAGMLE